MLIKISKKEWIKLAQESPNIVKKSDGSIIIIPNRIVQHISTHNQVGVGSIFASSIDIGQLSQIVKDIPVQGSGGLYSFPLAGYDLVKPIEEALKLPDAKQTTAQKEEGEAKIEVPAITTSASLDSFKTDKSNIVIRLTPPEYVPDEFKSNTEIVEAATNKKLYTVLTAFPGNPNIPKTSAWGGKFAVIIPKTNTTSKNNKTIILSKKQWEKISQQQGQAQGNLYDSQKQQQNVSSTPQAKTNSNQPQTSPAPS